MSENWPLIEVDAKDASGKHKLLNTSSLVTRLTIPDILLESFRFRAAAQCRIKMLRLGSFTSQDGA